MTLDVALAGMRKIPQWFIWRLEWLADEGKYSKVPVALHGQGDPIDAGLPANWSSYEDALGSVRKLDMGEGSAVRYALGFRLTDGCGYWFLDLDKCVDAPYGKLLPFAAQLVAAFPGALVEWSSSGKGVHVIGRGHVPEHRTRPLKDAAQQLLPMQLEFYTKGRGIAFGLQDMATGSADAAFDMTSLVDAYFKPRAPSDSAARGDWRGPADDDVLIERALGARLSAEATFNGKVTFAQLWRGEAEHTSENDAALASHLAFWTGCDEERMERLMWRSGMVRDKWRVHRTYLQLTINSAIDSCSNVYKEPERNLTVQTEMYGPPVATVHHDGGERISAEMFDKVGVLLDKISECGDEPAMHNEVIPQIQMAGIPGALQERLVTAVKHKLKFWDNNIGVAKLRAMLFPPASRAAGDSGSDGLPDWAKPYVFVASRGEFYNTSNDQWMSMISFQAVFGRMMPINETGRRDSATERCLHFWGMPIVEQVGYRPDQPATYIWDGVHYANSYSPSSLPAVATEYSEAGIAGINAFKLHLWDMCGRRQDVFDTMLYWFAHNVQYPGKKIRWAPIIKGVNGDGKTLLMTVLRAAMGHRNVRVTSNSTLKNSGGFTDWAVRGAVNVIEEIMLVGAIRHQLYNAMKEFVTNNIVDINPKGAQSYQTYNSTNHCALTNHNDALPMEQTDRRWLVIFTPWSSLDDMARYCGITAAQWKQRSDLIDHAKEHCQGELRAWFLSMQIPPTFDINGSALMTPEKRRMMASGADDAESVAAAIIANGANGITENVLSSSHLSRMLQIKSQLDAFDMPRGIALNHMLTRMGYSKLEKQIKWQGQTHTIWIRNGIEMDNDSIRLALDNSNPTQTQTQTLLTP